VTSSRAAAIAATLALALAGCGNGSREQAKRAAEVEVVAAGDIARCESANDEATAELVAAQPKATVLALGDNVYHSGLEQEFERCYAPSWGPFKDRTRPVPGNHEYEHHGDAGPYFKFFAEAAGPEGRGYYSFDLGSWHLVALNSNCEALGLGGCGGGSRQVRWLRGDLRRTEKACILAFWHHPRFSSGSRHGSIPVVAPFWDVLYEHGAEIVLNGHEHNYQRFAPQTPSGSQDARRGIREFVVGTGGADPYPTGPGLATTEVQQAGVYGILRLTLFDGRYEWQFEPAGDGTFTDHGSGDCH
jgi:acid phosphatase type 7